jgi:hypothetical protein
MQTDRKTDVADILRHVFADADPTSFGPMHPVDTAVILLIQQIRRLRMQRHAMGVVAKFRKGIRVEIRTHPGVQDVRRT